MGINIPPKFTDNIKKDINYQIKISPAVIKVPFTTDIKKTKYEDDVTGHAILYVNHENKWFEVVGEVHKDYKGEKQDHYLVRVNKKEYAKAYPFNSFGYFVLPPELEAVYGKRCKTLTDICFMSNNIEEIFTRASHIKFDMGKVGCVGDGEKARRLNPATAKYEDVKCVCAWSRYFTDYTGEELATEVNIKEAGLTATDNRTYSDKQQVLFQGAWRNILSRDGATIKLEPFKDNKAPCDFNFEILFMVPKVPGLHLNKLHSTGIENYLRLKESIANIKSILAGFGINIAAQPMNLILRIAEKNTAAGKRLYPQISIEFSKSIMELIRRSSKETFLEEGFKPEPVMLSEKIDTDTGEEFEDGEYDQSETTSIVPEEYTSLYNEIITATKDPEFVTKHYAEIQITVADTEDFYTQAIPILKELKLKLF